MRGLDAIEAKRVLQQTNGTRESMMEVVRDQTRDVERQMASPAAQSEAEVVEQRLDLKHIAKSSVLLAVLALASQFTGLLREGTISYFLGATKVADAYIAAFQPIEVLTSALLLSLPFGMIPFLLLYREKYGAEVAQWAASRVQLGTVPVIALGCALLYPWGRWVMHLSDPVLSGSQLELSTRLWHWMLPVVVLACITAFFLAELIADHRFICQGLNPILLNLSIVGMAFVCWRAVGVFGLAAGVLLGFGAQVILQTWVVLKRRRLLLPSPTPRPGVFSKAVFMIGPVVLLHVMAALNAPIPRRFAAQFGDGSLAAFTYAMRAWMPILLLGALSISYPYFSSFAASISKDREQARRLLRSMVRATFLFALPATAAVTLLRHDIVRVLFFRGAFDARAAVSVSSTVAFLSPFLLGSILADLLSRCLIALRRPLLACAIYGAMLVLIWAVAEQSQRFGVNAIALGWSACFYAGTIGFSLAINHYLPKALSELVISLAKVVAASSISALFMTVVSHGLDGFLPGTLAGSIVRIAATLSAGAIAMIGASSWLRVSEVQFLIRSVASWNRRAG
jgi:putative peptidoglycan lipid II flippase